MQLKVLRVFISATYTFVLVTPCLYFAILFYHFFFNGATARGGRWPPLQYASKPLDSLLCLFIHLFPSFSGPWTRHPAISFLVFLFVLLHTVFRTISYLHHLPWLQHSLNVPCAKYQVSSFVFMYIKSKQPVLWNSIIPLHIFSRYSFLAFSLALFFNSFLSLL